MITALRAGHSQSHMARFYSMPRFTVANIMCLYCIHGTIKLSQRRGHKPKLSTRGMRLLLKYARAHRFDPLYVITANYRHHAGVQLSINTVRRFCISMVLIVTQMYLSCICQTETSRFVSVGLKSIYRGRVQNRARMYSVSSLILQ